MALPYSRNVRLTGMIRSRTKVVPHISPQIPTTHPSLKINHDVPGKVIVSGNKAKAIAACFINQQNRERGRRLGSMRGGVGKGVWGGGGGQTCREMKIMFT